MAEGQIAPRREGPAQGLVRCRAGARGGRLCKTRNHLHPEADHIRHAMDDLVRAARIIDAARQTVSHPQPLFHLSQSENPAVGRPHAAVETRDDGLAANR